MNEEYQATSGLRRDAERNRRRIVTAAREVFAAHGLDAPLEEIARRAGVGIATLYRRFPTRQALIEEIFAARLELMVQAAEEALRLEDAWEGFSAYLFRLCALQAEDCGVRDVLRMTFPTARCLEATRARGYTLATQLIDRAKEQGSLRDDVSPEDLVYLLIANGAFVAAAGGIKRTAWKRYVALFLEGCRADRAHPLPEPPLSGDQMFRAMVAVSADNRVEERVHGLEEGHIGNVVQALGNGDPAIATANNQDARTGMERHHHSDSRKDAAEVVEADRAGQLSVRRVGRIEPTIDQADEGLCWDP